MCRDQFGGTAVDMRLDVLVLPVLDVDRAKAFYRSVGFREDFDLVSGPDFRVVRFTPPGSPTSIVFGAGVTSAAPGSVQGLILLVYDVEVAVAALSGRGIHSAGVFHDLGGRFYHRSPEFELPGPDPARRDYHSFARFSDPDGNEWVLQEVRHR